MYGSRLRFTLPQITNLQERIMSIAASASQLSFQSVSQGFFFQRRLDVVELGQAINSADLTKAQRAYNALTELGAKQDFLAVGQALQAGDAAGAQQAYVTLQQD